MTNGANQAYAACLLATCDPGDEVVLFQPLTLTLTLTLTLARALTLTLALALALALILSLTLTRSCSSSHTTSAISSPRSSSAFAC